MALQNDQFELIGRGGVLRVSVEQVERSFGSVARFIGSFVEGRVHACGECVAGSVCKCADGEGGAWGAGGRGFGAVVPVSSFPGSASFVGRVSGAAVSASASVCGVGVGSDSKDSSVRSGIESVVVGGGLTAVEAGKLSRGKHYLKNKVKREKRKAMNGSWRKSTVMSEFVSVFDGCKEEVKDELRDSRAKMLVEKNKLAAVKAVAEAKKLDARVQARVDELQLEEYRHKLDAERKKRIEAELSKLPAGYAETMVSEGISSPIPSLSDGSVSPNSSVSVAQVSRMEDCIQKLTARVAELTAESVERDVKQKAAAMMKASSRVQVRYNDGYSVWD